eukprot:CFRG2245T1
MTLPKREGYDVEATGNVLKKRYQSLQSLESVPLSVINDPYGDANYDWLDGIPHMQDKPTLIEQCRSARWPQVTHCQACDQAYETIEARIRTLTSTQYRQFFADRHEQYQGLHEKMHVLLNLIPPGAERNARDREATEMLKRIQNLINDSLDEALQKHGGASTNVAKRRRQLPPAAHSILKKWLYENQDCPYPSDEQKQQLAEECQLEIQQIRNWFANTRNRKRHLFARSES